MLEFFRRKVTKLFYICIYKYSHIIYSLSK